MKILKQWLKKIFADVHNAIVSLIVFAVAATLGGVAFSKSLKHILFEILQSPMPLWSTILLVLCSVVLMYAIMSRILNPSKSLPYKIKYFPIGEQKWKTTIYSNDSFVVDRFPICKTHDLPFIYLSNKFCCPEFLKLNCKNVIFEENHYRIYETAKSHIDKIVRNKEY